MYHSLFFDHCFVFVRFEVLFFVDIVEKTLVVPFFMGTLGHSAARKQGVSLRKTSRAVVSAPKRTI